MTLKERRQAAGMSQEEVDAIFEKMIEENPFAVLLTAFAAGMGDLQ